MGARIRITGLFIALALMVFVAIRILANDDEKTVVDATTAQAVDYEYDNEETNLELWLDRLEVDSRELYRQREGVIAATGVSDGDIVVDFASGTGLFSLLLAKTVENGGHVYAVDIAPRFLELTLNRALDEGLYNVSPVLSPPSSIPLQPNLADFVYISSAYFDFDDRFQAIQDANRVLKLGGRMMIIDFKFSPDNSKDPLRNNMTFGKTDVIREVESLGFEFIEEKYVDGVKENYLLTFRKNKNYNDFDGDEIIE